jgi:hypothetical protein
MSDASSAPVRRAPAEIHTSDLKIEQKPVIETREDLAAEIVVAPGDALNADYKSALDFAEDPVTIRIEPSGEKYAQKFVDVWCNGKGAEILINGVWREMKVLPIGMVVTTKRKYVEILARSKHTSVTTKVSDEDSEHPTNAIERFTSSKSPFSVIEDRSPKGPGWLSGVLQSL